MDEQDDERSPSIYLAPEQRRVLQAEKNRLMSQALQGLVGIPVHISSGVPVDEAWLVQDKKIVGKIVNVGDGRPKPR